MDVASLGPIFCIGSFELDAYTGTEITLIPPVPAYICFHLHSIPITTVRDSEKSLITTNKKSTTGFPTSYRWSVYVTSKSPKVWLKEQFFSFFD